MQLLINLVPSAQMRLEFIAKETGRKVEDLAATYVEEGALNFFRHRIDDDPVRNYRRLYQKGESQ